MFEKKEKVEYLEKDDVVYCDYCGVVIKRGFAQVVKEHRPMGLVTLHYCHNHKKPYSRINHMEKYDREKGFTGTYKTSYFTEVEVDEKGKPIKK